MSYFSIFGFKGNKYQKKEFLEELSFNSDEKSECEKKKIVLHLAFEDSFTPNRKEFKYYHCPNKEELNKFISMLDKNNCINKDYISDRTYNLVEKRYYLE